MLMNVMNVVNYSLCIFYNSFDSYLGALTPTSHTVVFVEEVFFSVADFVAVLTLYL